MVAIFFSPIKFNDQGLEIDPEEDQQKILLKNIEDNVKQLFEFHQFELEKDKRANSRSSSKAIEKSAK